jgi:putative transposase
VDHEGEVLERFLAKKGGKKAALKFLRKTLKRHGPSGEFVTVFLRSHGAALRELGM